ncbi:cytochrome P450 [Pseudonocardia kujensis]|uniref:cytochrome P450 n=1 Tax=Pseudonocardia kujensis TaxID=1128675 RepID=UPI001E3D7746|nr:cytochrome P450 [Pseudonocardia kujensis]MCE0764605.1 cytochrome P450 [Pseudonocardia kujensis]
MTSTTDVHEFNPMVSPHRENPHLFYKWSRAESPITFAPPLNAYMVTRYDDIKAVVDDPETYSSANSVPVMWSNPPEVVEALDGLIPEAETIVNTDEPAHGPLRDVLNHAFSGRRVRQQIPAMTARSNELVDAFLSGDRADLVGQYADPYVQLVVSLVFGIPREDVEKVQGWTDDYMLLMNPLAPVDGKVAAARRLHDYQHYIDQMADDRRAHPREDFMSDLVHGGENFPPVSHADLHYIFRGLRFAGHDTTRDLITSTLLLMLADDRKLWEKAQADRRSLPRIIEETLRRDAPHRGLMRITTREVTLGGTTLPAGASLLLLFGSANRDETHFPNPDVADLDRPNVREHLAFGSGIHQCPGAQLARTEVRIALETLLDRLPDLHLVPGFTPTYIASYFFRGLERLDVNW